jgi:hypothetical protein
MLTQVAGIDRLHGRNNGVPSVCGSSVWCTADQVLKQYPESALLVAAQRADAAYAGGRMFNFRLWSRVTLALAELMRQRTSADLVN